jgi:GT2 family glycosyltransferase
MKEYPSVAIIIVNWNGKGLLSTCLSSLTRKTTYPNYHVVVVDNGSLDGSPEFLRNKHSEMALVLLDRNYGFAVGNNIGIVYAQRKWNPDYVLLLNNDTEIISEDWLEKMVKTAESNDQIGIAGCKLVYPDGRIQHIGTKMYIQGPRWLDPKSFENIPEVFDVDAVLGACFLIKSKVLDKIGLLDENFSPFQHEESDYCMRAWRAGYKSCIVSSVIVAHSQGVSLNKVRSDYLFFVNRKNLIRFVLLNYSLKWLILHIPYEIRVFLSCIIEKEMPRRGFFPFKLRDQQESFTRTKLNMKAWFINLENLGEIITKRRNRTGKILPRFDFGN